MNFKKIITSLFLSLLSLNSKASFIDTDLYCVLYGCVVVSDNNTSNVYDAYDFLLLFVIPVGGQLKFSSNNPVVGSGTVDPLFTDTNTNVSSMAANQGNRLQVTNPLSGGVFTYPSSGLLDASTTLTKFGIQSTTRLDYAPAASPANLGDNPQSHSFYISSRGVTFNIRANATVLSNNGEFSSNVPTSNINFILNLTGSGNATNNGQSFGMNTSSNYNYTNVTGLSLSSLTTNPIVGAFNGANIYSPANSGASIYSKSVRLDALYTLPAFSLSQGSGTINWNIAFSFWRK